MFWLLITLGTNSFTAWQRSWDILTTADMLYQGASCGSDTPIFRLKLTHLHVFVDGDLYSVPRSSTGVTSLQDLRDAFRDWPRTRFGGADVRHLLTGLNTGSALGVANRFSIGTDTGVSLALVCRSEKNSECDQLEMCNGVSAMCPEDQYVDAGVACAGGEGMCYTGECRSYTQACDEFSSSGLEYTACPEEQVAEPCGNLWCVKPIVGTCGTVADPRHYGQKIQVHDGVPCGDAGQCYHGACVNLGG